MSDELKVIVLSLFICVVIIIACIVLAYRFSHPELTDTQLIIDIWKLKPFVGFE